jgi:formamidopyrimidine-DNA glycosylase
MFELPEMTVISQQMNEVLPGKTIERGELGNRPHKFVWYNRDHDEFARLARSKHVGWASVRGKWAFIPLEPDYVLVLGECGGKILYHEPGSKRPAKYHLLLLFADGSALSVTTRMWGAMELYRSGEEQDRQYIKDMRPTPVDAGFTPAYFSSLIDEAVANGQRSAKALLTQAQLVPGLGNAIAQDILFRAGLHPRSPIADLDQARRVELYDAIRSVVTEAIEGGGRNDEFDLYGQRGGYSRVMDASALQRPCPGCGGSIQKISYLGGSCYLCPTCQPMG